MGNFARASFFGATSLLVLVASCLGGEQEVTNGGGDGGAGDGSADGSADGGSGGDSSVEGGKPTPTGAVQWVVTVDVPNLANVRLAYDDSGDVVFATEVGTGSSPTTVNGQSYLFGSGLAVGKIKPSGSLAWLQVYPVTVDSDALDVAVSSTGDVWLLGGLVETSAVQNWNGTAVTKISPSSRGDIFWTNLNGSDGTFKSAFQMATASGGIDHSGLNYMLQSMRLSRVGNQLVGAIGHHGAITLPGPSGNIPIASGTGEAVTVFRADPVTGAVSTYDVYTGTAPGLSPGAITVRPDKSMAVAINVASAAQNQTITNAASNGGRGGISFAQTGAGTPATTFDAYAWFLVTAYSSADGVTLAQPYNNGGDNSGLPNLASADSISLSSTGAVEVGGAFIGNAVQMNNVTFAELAASEDSFMMTISPAGSVVQNPIIATTGTDGFASALFDPWDDLAASSVYGGTIGILRSAPSASDSNGGVSQFKILNDGGVSWNFGAFTNAGVAPTSAASIAVDAKGGNVAIGGFFSGSTDLGKGTVSPPNSGPEAVFVIGRSP